jgi:hypothetical protein
MTLKNCFRKVKMKKFKDPIYGFTYYLFDGPLDEIEDNCIARTYFLTDFDEKKYKNIYTLSGIYFNLNFFEMKKEKQIGIIAHECWHLTEKALFGVGIHINIDEYNEHFAYYLQFLVENYSKLLNAFS